MARCRCAFTIFDTQPSRCCSLLVPPHVVREIVGHSDIKVTMTVYAHGHLAEKAAALTQLGTAITGTLPSPLATNSVIDDHESG